MVRCKRFAGKLEQDKARLPLEQFPKFDAVSRIAQHVCCSKKHRLEGQQVPTVQNVE